MKQDYSSKSKNINSIMAKNAKKHNDNSECSVNITLPLCLFLLPLYNFPVALYQENPEIECYIKLLYTD